MREGTDNALFVDTLREEEAHMKAAVVVDNIKHNSIPGEWGLCIFIEYGDKKILLDTGASTLFAENAGRLNIKLSDVDLAVLSHAHYDHANGMGKFFEVNDKAKFYLQNSCAENCYAKKWIFSKYIGMPRGIIKNYQDRIVYVSGNYGICEGVGLVSHTTPGLGAIGKRESMYQKRGGRWYPEDFSHEQSLVCETPAGLVVFNSCSHGGFVNIVHEVTEAYPGKKVLAYIGGLHLCNKTAGEVRELAKDMKNTGIEYIGTGHCTGKRAYEILREELGDTVHQFYTGAVMEF